MEWESDSPWCSQAKPGQGWGSPGRCSGWEVEFGECRAISGREVLWLWRDGLRGCEGDCDRKCLWRKAGQPWKQGDTAESCIGGGSITIASFSPQASISNWTIERLTHKMPDTLNYIVGLHTGCPFKCLMHWSKRRTPIRGASLCA